MLWVHGDEERETKGLIVIHAVANTTIGVSLLLWSNLGAENVMTRAGFPMWLWPCMFIIAGVMALFGLTSRYIAQFSFVFAAIVTSVFGFASLYAVIEGNLASIPSTVFLLYITILKLAVARMIRQRDDIVQQVTAATEKGQSVLDSISDGTTNTRRQ
jgi:hypothetical protein